MTSFERHIWSVSDPAGHSWVNDIVWQLISGSTRPPAAPGLEGIPATAPVAAREAILHNGLAGFVKLIYGDNLAPALGRELYDEIDIAAARTELFVHEVHWLLGLDFGSQIIAVGDFGARAHYKNVPENTANPRFVRTLDLWTPTLATREEVSALLRKGGFQQIETSAKDSARNQDYRDYCPVAGYLFQKINGGIAQMICLRSTLWESAKNWSLDIERDIWDRAHEYGTTFPLRLEATDDFIVTCRRFSIDSLGGSAGILSDLIRILERVGDSIEWNRVRSIKNMFQKPDWLWVALLGIAAYEHKTGKKFDLPEWARKGAAEANPFLGEFLATRLNWGCPDARIMDFPRAFMKVSKGS